MQHAHQKGIIHRDLKPSNILVTLHDGVPAPKVIDFGVAKATQQQRLTDLTIYTQFEQMIGTPLYMSPEQAEMSGLDIDTRSDIYSLGVLLYELLAGRTPFDPETLMKAGFDEMRRVIREQEPQRPSTFVSTMAAARQTDLPQHRQTEPAKLIGQIRGDLDWIVMRALDKDRSRRYETATGLAQDIQRHLADEPVQARPPSHFYRFRRLVRRNKIAFATATAVLAALLAGLGASTWMYFKEKQTRERAVTAEKKTKAEALKSEQVAKFLKDMLDGVGPSVALGRDTKLLREILDKTAEHIGKDLKDQLAVEAELRSILGEVYKDIGEYEKARTMHREALAIQRTLFGEQHPDVAASLHSLGTLFSLEGKWEEAETLYREALAIGRNVLGKDHPQMAALLSSLAGSLKVQQDFGCRAPDISVSLEAETMAREALALQRQAGNDDAGVAATLSNVALMLQHQARFAEAETKWREALAIQRKVFGDQHPEVADTLRRLGNVLHLQRRLADSEGMFREAILINRKVAGNEHPTLALNLCTFGRILEEQNKFEDAEKVYRESWVINRKRLGDENPDVAECLLHVVAMLGKQKKLTEAETLLREVWSIDRKRLGGKHPDVAYLLNSLVGVLRGQGKLAEAKTTILEALAVRRKMLRDEHEDVAASLMELGTFLRE